MRRSRLSILLALPLAACEAPTTLDLVADARAAELTVDAADPVRIGGAMGGLIASICDLGVDDWGAMDGQTLAIPEAIGDKLGIVSPGAVAYDSDTGGVEVEWPARVKPGQDATLKLEVLRATSTYKLSFDPDSADGDTGDSGLDGADSGDLTGDTGAYDGEPRLSGEASISIGTCGDNEATLELELEILRGSDDTEIVLLPAGETSALWSRGEIWPSEGQIQWSRGASNPSVSLPATADVFLSNDASEISARQWPGVVSNEEWERSAQISLMR